LIFTLLDGAAGAALLSGVLGKVSLWWFELAISVFAIVSLPALWWCHEQFADPGKTPGEKAAADGLSEDLA
jgi:hypothetical protein